MSYFEVYELHTGTCPVTVFVFPSSADCCNMVLSRGGGQCGRRG